MPQLQSFLQNDDEDKPADPPALVQAVAQQMPNAQATEASLQRTWSIEPTEQRRYNLAQPAWKTETQRNQPPMPQPKPPATPLAGAAPLTPAQETEEERMSHLEDGHWSPREGCQSSTSTQRADDARLDALDQETSLEDADWEKFGNFQVDNIR